MLAFILPAFIVFLALPYSSFVDIHKVEYADVCVGSDTQEVTAMRDVKFFQAYNASVSGELFKYEEQRKLETIVKRNIDFIYQRSASPVVYEIKWDAPLMEVGEYGASEFLKLHVGPIVKEHFISEDELRFSVIECD